MSHDRELHRLLSLPCTILREGASDREIILRVEEIPSAVGTGASATNGERNLRDSLTESLTAYRPFGDPVPLPKTSSRLQRETVLLSDPHSLCSS